MTTRVKFTDEDDWGKLKHCMKYLKQTRGMNITLQADILKVIKFYADGSFETHHECCDQTSVIMTLVYGSMPSFSSDHKLNEKISTEIELIGLRNALPSKLWNHFFIMGQGYSMIENISHHDNIIAMCM